MIEVLVALAWALLGGVVGWIACSWHWHTRLAESWARLRVATWRRQERREPVAPERALDVGDVTDAFGYGMVAEREPEAGQHQQLRPDRTEGSVSQSGTMA